MSYVGMELPQKKYATWVVIFRISAGYPSKLTGMLASGRPMIATANPGTQIYDVVSQCGLNVPPGAADEFAAAICKLVKNADMRHQLGKHCREIAESEPGMDISLERFEKDVLKLCSHS